VAAPRVERRLAAILAADVVGFARLVERNEQGTLARLRRIAKSYGEFVREVELREATAT
jgi:adenylate cyclase